MNYEYCYVIREIKCGKTTTLNKVYDTISPNETDIIQKKNQLGAEVNDFECIVKYNEKNVAFFTMGDYSRYLIEAFKKYNNNCDVLVCACNDRFKRPYKEITNQTYCDILNEDDKKKILDLI